MIAHCAGVLSAPGFMFILEVMSEGCWAEWGCAPPLYTCNPVPTSLRALPTTQHHIPSIASDLAGCLFAVQTLMLARSAFSGQHSQLYLAKWPTLADGHERQQHSKHQQVTD